MIALQSFANSCQFTSSNNKYYIEADGKLIKEVSESEYGNYDLLQKEFGEYLKKCWPSFWQNPLKYLGLIK